MKTETIIIPDDAYLREIFATRQLPLGTSLQKLCIIIANEAYGELIPCLYIKIGSALVPDSYRVVPAMFAKLLEGRIDYHALQAYNEKDTYLVLRCAKKRRPATFKARVFKTCSEGKAFKAKKENIPKSYRYRPGLMSRMLTDELCTPFAYVANKETITWKRLTSEEE